MLIVDGTGGEEGRYATLGAAIRGANSGDIIELHYDHPDAVEQPLTLDKNLTIRAGRNPQRDGELFQPVIVFRPTPDDVTNRRWAMITVRGADIKLEGIHVQMDLDIDRNADYWSMFQVHGAEHLQLSGCSLTIRNTPDTTESYHHPEVSFFDVQATPGGSSITTDGMEKETPVPIDLNQCIVRGEAVFLAARKLQPLKLEWTGGLLATTEQFLVAGSGQEKRASGGYIRIVLKQVTAVTRRGMYLSTNDRDEPHQLNASFDLSNCILIGDDSSQHSLIEQTGVDDTGRKFDMRLDWSGRRNVYQSFDFEAFWRIRRGEPSAEADLISTSIDFTKWLDRWDKEVAALRTEIKWKAPPDPDQPVHSLTPLDYQLNETAPSNPARGDGNEPDSGFDLSLLPQLPPTVSLPKAGDEKTIPETSPAVDDAAAKPSTSDD